jgi:hypothetical protein
MCTRQRANRRRSGSQCVTGISLAISKLLHCGTGHAGWNTAYYDMNFGPLGLSKIATRTLIFYGDRDSQQLPEESYKRKCQETYLSVGSVPTLFCFGIQPNRLNVHS